MNNYYRIKLPPMKQRIALIMPYFGKWPEWIDLFLYSCSRNPQIDFLFYTDCPVPEHPYSNVKFTAISFADYCDRASAALGIDFHPSYAYKLCDLKPFYGIIHEAELKGYDWWGFGDLDLIYGDMQPLLRMAEKSKYDVLTTHLDRIAGHFTLIRCHSEYNACGMKLKNWKQMLEDKTQNYGIDEDALSVMLRPLHIKVFGFIYNHLITRLFGSNKGHWFYYYWGKLTRFIPTRIFMEEYFTTFKPAPDTCCTYDLGSGRIYVQAGQQTWIMGGDKIYLHFLFFKKTQFWDTDQYWRDGFYQIPKDFDFSQGGIVEISTKHIRLRQEARTD